MKCLHEKVCTSSMHGIIAWAGKCEGKECPDFLGWIDVKEKLPNLPCLALWTDRKITILDELCHIDYCINHRTDFRVIAWMPLPEIMIFLGTIKKFNEEMK
jgi:hypothetical protein